ncbi:Zn(2)-C6 fungal-type domain-containing protein [Mycena sanguinolenta]|uniref:Zn(2)-C6 fungal-type domain-containing protein n=1 Tax=Mycena sanguinolenta TaxID=230812 RepID=A0A8H7CL92_9AGAR|nr:Zn(2)-C6 fungal-type domain-containing protein [Mycena sanguinolenta]
MNNEGSFQATESFKPLNKGAACINCRRRKIKCDGVKPMCGQCSRYSTAFSDCEYSEDGPTKSQMLEEQISILQNRIQELERPSRSRSSGSSQISSRHRESSSVSQITPTNATALGPLLSYFYLQQTSGISFNETAINSMPTELPFIVLQALVHNFLHNASCFGFFLDTQAFHDAITSTDGKHLPPVLMNVMYLWGIHLSEDPKITVYEPAFLSHALRSTASSLSGTHPRTILHSIQASVLLAYYFIRNARFLEGKYHISAAVSIALSAGLHHIRGPRDSESARTQAISRALATPQDTREEGERIDAFWAVLAVNNCWASRDGASSNISYGPASALAIHTPWPLDIADYVERPHLLPSQSSETIKKFLEDAPDNATSCAALYAKTSVLYEEATRVSARYRSGGIPLDDPEFSALDRKIDEFTSSLPAIQSKRMLMVHTLARGATILLHNALTTMSVGSRTKTLVSARAVVDILARTDIPNMGIIDPALAPLWTTTCLAFITEMGDRESNTAARLEQLKSCLDRVVAAMENFAPHCRLMAVQLEAVRQAYGEIRSDNE